MKAPKNTQPRTTRNDKPGKPTAKGKPGPTDKVVKQSRQGKPGVAKPGIAKTAATVAATPRKLRPIHAPKPQPSVLHYFVVYKPYGMMSQFSVENDRPVLANLDQTFTKDVYPVEPINADSEGLLILTNDRALKQLMLDASKKTSKTYVLQVEGEVTPEALKTLSQGVSLTVEGKETKTAKAKVKIIEKPYWLTERNPPVRYRKSVPDTWLELSIIEGKNSQIRRMTAAVGFPTLRLVRTAIGKLSLDIMRPAEVKEVKREDLNKAL